MSQDIYTDNVSTEPLDIIRANECESQVGSLATSRFRAMWNEIARLRAALATPARDQQSEPSPASEQDMAVYQSIADGYTPKAQQAGEVVAHVLSYKPLEHTAVIKWYPAQNGVPPAGFNVGTKLYTTPPAPAQPAAQPVQGVPECVQREISAALGLFPIWIEAQTFRIGGYEKPLEADGDTQFYSKRKVLALLEKLYGHLAAAASPTPPAQQGEPT